MNGSYSKTSRSFRRLSYALSMALGLAGTLLLPHAAIAQEQELTWARVDFLRNRVQLVPQDQQGRRARISDVLSVGDSLRTARASRAELRFNDGSLARIGERATFRFTPNTRNFQLSNGTILLLIPPGRGRSTIQTPNAVTGIQGSALFVRYIPETDTTIVGALTNNPNGPMVLFNRDGTEQQALRANEIGVIQGDQITELYEFDGTLFWQSSGLAEGFNYLSDSSTGSDALDGVRQEIREAISTQDRLSGDRVITNPETFATPSTELPEEIEVDDTPAPVLEFEDSPAQEYLESSAEVVDESSLEVGVNNNLAPAVSAEEDLVADSREDVDPNSSSAESTTEEDITEEVSEESGSNGGESNSGQEVPNPVDGEVTSSEAPAGEGETVDADVVAPGLEDSLDSSPAGGPEPDTTGGDAVELDTSVENTPETPAPITDTLDIETGDDLGGADIPESDSLSVPPSDVPELPPENDALLNSGDAGVVSPNLGANLEPTVSPEPELIMAPDPSLGSEQDPPTILGTPVVPDPSALPESSVLPESTFPETAPIEDLSLGESGLPDTLDSLDEIQASEMDLMEMEMEMMEEGTEMMNVMDSDDVNTQTTPNALGTPSFGEDAP